jgi:hypothetical protein
VDVVKAINSSFKAFRRYDRQLARDRKAAMVATAKAVAECIVALESELETAPALLRSFLFTPPESRRAGTAADVDALLAAKTTYEKIVLDALRAMRRDCEKFLADQPREPLRPGPEMDRAQQHCARLAYSLMKHFSKKRISGYSDGPFVGVASLLYELMTSRSGVDLSRHCKAVLKDPSPI